MSDDRFALSRRALLRGMTAVAGAAAAPALWSGLKPAEAGYATTRPDLPSDFGGGRSVAIVGAGVAGLTAAFVLANAGFQVSVFEADGRYGGRSLTVRSSDEALRSVWFDRYDPKRSFPDMYVDRYSERADSPAAGEQVCTFDDPGWTGENEPVDLFLNAGPGRIPSNHVNLIALCQDIGVEMEPYIFQSMSNLLQSPSFNGGAPIPFGQVTYSLFAEMAEMMALIVREACKLQGAAGAEARELANLSQLFGDLERLDGDACTLRIAEASRRLGFSDLPGGWRHAGEVRERIELQKILDSRFVGDASANPELSPGSYLFNRFNIDWQPTLMQPVGGMDRIWQRLLVQEVPAAALPPQRLGSVPSQRTAMVGDLVFLATPVRSIAVGEDRVRVNGEDFDYCISTMSPTLLGDVLQDSSQIPGAFWLGLGEFQATGGWDDGGVTPNLWTPAIKVGWQGRTRFWETENEIYGGISWTTDIIGQVWYPSEDFTERTGIMTGAYNRGGEAARFAQMNQAERLAAARKGFGLLHPDKVDQLEHGVSIAWQYMPHQTGGWASDTALESPKVYERITTFNPNGRFTCAGDTWSYWPGWQEGAVASAYCAINAIARSLDPTDNAYAASACFGTAR
jgi:monoamine oxidase